MAHQNTSDQPSSGNISMPQKGSKEPVDHKHKQFDTYTSIDEFKTKNQLVIDKAKNIKSQCEQALDSLILEADIDDDLLQAVNNEWPQELEEPVEPRVTYRFYRILRNRPTTAAGLIRRRYERAARSLSSTPHLDILKTADIVLKEARLQKENLLPHLGQNTDKAEKRIVEGMFDWCVNANVHLESLRYIVEKDLKGDYQLPEMDAAELDKEQTRQAQATFNAQYNATNMDITKSLDLLRSQFSEEADNFYNKFLTPALDFRLQVGRKIIPDGNQIAGAMHQAANALDSNFEGILQDQVRRNLLFQREMDSLVQRLFNRERYRIYINQLSSKGSKVTQTGLFKGKVSNEEAEFWEHHDPADPEEILYTPNLRRPSEAIQTGHDLLLGIDEPDAHSQYILESGDILTGNLDAQEGVLIDGADIDQHRHTGEDGTPQISGADIENGTIGDGHVNPNPPPVPTDLEITNYNQRVKPPGLTVIDATVQWEGEDGLTYEIEIFDRTSQVSQ